MASPNQPLDTAPGMELFTSYESDFTLALAEVNQKLQELPELKGEPRKASSRAIERALDEADEILSQMAMEIQNISTSSRGSLNTRLRGYRNDLEKVRKDAKGLADQADRRELFGSRYQDDPAIDQRQQLLSGTQRLENASDRIASSQRLANETEMVGSNILTDLRGQREQIVNSRNTLMQADGYVDRSMRTLRGMARRMATNRIITIAIITILVIMILLVIASKFW